MTENNVRLQEQVSDAQLEIDDLEKRLQAAQQEAEAVDARFRGVHEGLQSTQSVVRENTEDVYQVIHKTAEHIETHLVGLGAVVEAGLRSIGSVNRLGANRNTQDEQITLGEGHSLELRSRWLDLVERTLTGTLSEDKSMSPWNAGEYDAATRMVGRDWPVSAFTMIGSARMKSLRSLCEMVIADGVEGDFLEAGVWRGGASIYMAAIVLAYQQKNRRIFVADSFCGLPEPSDEYAEDAGDTHSEFTELAVSREDVERNFDRYGLKSDSVVFVEGFFKDTLHNVDTEKLALLRLDGDMYESTIQSLNALYRKVVPGGIVIIDDYVLGPCAQAVDSFRREHGIVAEIHQVDGAAIWWQIPHSE